MGEGLINMLEGELRAKPKPRVQSARELRAKPELREKPDRDWEGSGPGEGLAW